MDPHRQAPSGLARPDRGHGGDPALSGIGEGDQGEPPVAWAAPEPARGPAPGIEFAPHGPRIAAYLIDATLLIALVIGLFLPLLSLEGADTTTRIVLGLAVLALALVLEFGYFPWFWLRGGRTPGMRLFRLRVVRDRDGGPLTRRDALLRTVGLFFVSPIVLYLGFAWALVDRRRRTWHDLLAGTVVIRD